MDDYVSVAKVLSDEVTQQRKDLQNAIRRRKRAVEAVQKADNDIAGISGALMALETIWRKLQGEVREIESGGAEVKEAPPQTFATLAGELNSLTSQPTTDPPE